MLAHLIYISTRTKQCTEEEIEKILESCKKNNSKKTITGVLLYSSTTFVQYLEGEYKELSQLYDQIKLDPRHKNAMMVSSAPISERSFPGWHMGSKKLEMQDVDFKTDINHQERSILKDILAGKKQDSQKAIGLIQRIFK